VETLSSRFTFVYKYVFTTFWIAGFVYFGFKLLFADASGGWLSRIFGPLGAVGCAYLIWLSFGSLKRVQLGPTSIEISNYRDSISVPLSEIADVSENPLPRQWRIVTVKFRHPTPFGRSIEFMPPYSFMTYSEHEATKRLRLAQSPGADAQPN